jgi:hypothetical protein
MNSLILPIGLFLIFCYRIYQKYNISKNDEEYYIREEKNRKDKLKKLIEERDFRVDFKEYNEEAFWEIIQKAQNRGGNSYKNNLGLLKDYLTELSPKELIQVDNLIERLFKDFINQDLYATSNIIFKTNDLSGTYLLMSIFMCRGEVFYKNACLNPNLIIGKEIIDFDGRIITGVIEELYVIKTNKLIPLPETNTNFEIKGVSWTQKELPSKYSELWMEYA